VSGQALYTAVYIGVVVIGGLVAYFGFVTRISSRVTAIETRCKGCSDDLRQIPKLCESVTKLESQNAVFWAVMEPHLGGIIHSPRAQDRDGLVDKLVSRTITRDEALVLSDMLYHAIQQPAWSADKRLAATLLLARVRIRLETGDHDAA
jgi:hypothetical protein